jgi:hypothetical protein
MRCRESLLGLRTQSSFNQSSLSKLIYMQCRDLLEDSDVKQIEASVKTHAKATTSDVTVSINVHENKASVDPFCLHVCWPEDQECPYGLVRLSPSVMCKTDP